MSDTPNRRVVSVMAPPRVRHFVSTRNNPLIVGLVDYLVVFAATTSAVVAGKELLAVLTGTRMNLEPLVASTVFTALFGALLGAAGAVNLRVSAKPQARSTWLTWIMTVSSVCVAGTAAWVTFSLTTGTWSVTELYFKFVLVGTFFAPIGYRLSCFRPNTKQTFGLAA